uniref:Uncharacterized protein n=1 Tax=Rhizophora mucronata TaxID=61149 RepID=A0A2P2P494_RHIMU
MFVSYQVVTVVLMITFLHSPLPCIYKELLSTHPNMQRGQKLHHLAKKFPT